MKAQELCNVEEENDFRTVVNYFHDRHVVLHFSDMPELDHLVVLDSQWLIDICKMVITVKPWECQEEAFRKHWQTLEREGVLHLELVQHVWKDLIPEKETIAGLLLLLEKLGLVYRWTQPNGVEVCEGVCASLSYTCTCISSFPSCQSMLTLAHFSILCVCCAFYYYY